jgi:putative transposase
MGYLKGKSALMIFDRDPEYKKRGGDRHFWAEGYYVDTVGRNEEQIQKYIKEQEDADRIEDNC